MVNKQTVNSLLASEEIDGILQPSVLLGTLLVAVMHLFPPQILALTHDNKVSMHTPHTCTHAHTHTHTHIHSCMHTEHCDS